MYFGAAALHITATLSVPMPPRGEAPASDAASKHPHAAGWSIILKLHCLRVVVRLCVAVRANVVPEGKPATWSANRGTLADSKGHRGPRRLLDLHECWAERSCDLAVLLEADVNSPLTEAATAHHDAVLADQTVSVVADTAVRGVGGGG